MLQSPLTSSNRAIASICPLGSHFSVLTLISRIPSPPYQKGPSKINLPRPWRSFNFWKPPRHLDGHLRRPPLRDVSLEIAVVRFQSDRSQMIRPRLTIGLVPA